MASSYTAPQNLASALLEAENASAALKSAWDRANIKIESADQVSERLSYAYNSPIFHHMHPEMEMLFHDWHYFHEPHVDMFTDMFINDIRHELEDARFSLDQFFETTDTEIISDAINDLNENRYEYFMPHMMDPFTWDIENNDYRYRLDQAEQIISDFAVEFDDLNIDPIFQDINENSTSIEYSTPAFNTVRDEIDSARDLLEQSLSLINDKPEHLFNLQHEAAYKAMASLDLFGEINIALNPDFEGEITAQIDQSKNDIRHISDRFQMEMEMGPVGPEWHMLYYGPVGDEMRYAASEVYDISTEINESYASLVALDDSLVDYNSALRDLADLNEDAPETTAGPASIGFDYELYDGNGDYLTQLSVLGDDVSYASEFTLEIDTKSFEDDYALESADITIKFNPDLFDWIDESDISIGGSLPIANAVKVDNDLGTIRIAAASLSDVSDNSGSAITATSPLASISLNFDEEEIKLLEKNDDGSLKISPLAFEITANEEETVFSKSIDDGTGFENREISSLAQLGGSVHVEGQDVTLYEAKINLAQQDDGLVLSTERVIGADATTTNLVRSGDTLTTSTSWLNVGNIEANNLSYEAIVNANASLVHAEFSETDLLSGSFIEGEFVEDARESTVLTTDIHITGQAGSVVDLSDGIISIKADAEGSDSFSNAGKGSSNLITFQGDLNYDGRVSMKDLAYLNAGAARQELVDVTENGSTIQVASEDSYARDVDADFNGKIDLADLSILDADWGESLHTGDGDFQGSADISWDELDAQGDYSNWDNSSFKDQNAIEAESSYVGSLEGPGATGVVGSEGIEDGSNTLEGEYFQDLG